ncbi:SusC/RagA family TonB-linked outer membrane protein [Flexithrix dorotheae]|uniref:SusC/RagA family TonB-linked outer membrane protein n=1 Tax=Flexithrix dorotheae TaxID=70993 RepID=UPI000369E3D7|nr:SusC/RagA family TonB-linked outer membrane protein [Flexithrix dorotheae]
MKLNVIRQIWLMSKYAIYGMLIQGLCYSFILAKSGHTQPVSIEDVYLSIKMEDVTLKQALSEIERKSDFYFSFHEVTLEDKRITINKRRESLANLLREISSETNLKFKRVNDNIHISEKEGDPLARVEEVLNPVQREVSGKVTSAEDGEPLPGVNILVKGTMNGTVTDFDGNFKVNVEAEEDILVFSYIGFISKEVPVANQSNMDVALELDVTSLSEVVVVGYGQQEKKDVTGVIEEVNSESFNNGAIVNPDQLIAGKVAGVQIISNSGEPGGQTSIRIRGGTSLSASNEPLYVIDGVPVDNSPHNPGGFQSGRNPLNFINPNDIESFTVLKDASAAAIYGSRAANGVIIITTKKGNRGGKGSISYDGWMSVANPIKMVDVLSADEFRSVLTERAPDRVDILGNSNTDWQDQIYQNGFGQNHAVSFSGGGENTGFRASIGHLDQDGIVKTSNTKRTSLGINYNQRLFDDKLKIDANVKVSDTKDRFAPNGIIGGAVRMDPTQSIYDANSEWGGYFEYENDLGNKNPVAELNLTEDYGKTFRSLGNVQFDYELPYIDGLNAKLNLGYDITSGERKRFLPSNLRSQYTDNGEIRRANFRKESTLLDFFLDYNKRLDGINSNLSATAGYSYQDFSNEFPEFRAWDLSSNLLGFNSAAPASNNSSAINILENRLISFWGRVNYGYKDKYLLTLTLRRDGSSRFGETNKWGTFPSAAFAWRIFDENFMEGIASGSFLSDLKFRVGWGVTGNQEIGDYKFLPTYTYGDNLAQYQFGDQFYTTVRPNGYDPNLKWEETESLNIGLDYELIDGKLYGSIEYYQKNTSDLLSNITVPAGSNLTNIILTNIGSLENKGVEFTINSVVISKPDVTWNLGFNISTNKNKITKLTNFEDPDFKGYPTGGISGGVGNNIQINRVGEPINSFYVFKHKRDANGNPLLDGVDHNEDGEINLADIYEDTNGDEQVNDLDKVTYKNPAADVSYGLTSQLNVKNFDFSFTLRGNVGNYVYNNVASNGAYYNRIITEITPSNLVSSINETNFTSPQYFSDVYIENASFLRMDNMTLGYSFNQLQNMKLRLYGTIQNLFVITDYTGLDPEIGNISGNTGTPRFGIDDNAYPRARTFMLGLSLGF